MENAADAIKIAGELLIGLLLISLLVFVFNKISSVEKEKDQQKLIAQTTEFNNKFNAFNKTSMYGTDLISVLGLAYATNKSANLETTYKSSASRNYDGYYDPDLENSIDIHFKLGEETKIESKTTVTTTILDPKTHELLGSPSKSSDPDPPIIFNSNTWYSLSKEQTGYEKIVKNIKEIVIDGNTTETNIESHITIEDGKNVLKEITTVKDASGFDAFKKCIFKCTEVKYSDTGRIKEMYFEEK